MESSIITFTILLTGFLLVNVIQDVDTTRIHMNIRPTRSSGKDLFDDDKILSNIVVNDNSRRIKRQSGYNDRNRRFPYPIPILGGGGFGSRGFGERGFGGRGFSGRGFGSRGFGGRGFGGRGIGGLGRGIGGFGGRGRG